MCCTLVTILSFSGSEAAGVGRQVQAAEGNRETGEVYGQEEEEECTEGQEAAALQETLTTNARTHTHTHTHTCTHARTHTTHTHTHTHTHVCLY